MTIRWQLWFLISFVVVASCSLYKSMVSYGEGEKIAQSNWTYVQSQNLPTLAAYCQKFNLTSAEKEPAQVSRDVFKAQENPVFCAASLDEAKKQYGLYAQTLAKNTSIRVTFTFIGVWIAILLIGFGLNKIRRKKKP